MTSPLKAPLEEWADSEYRGDPETAREMLALLWPVIEAAEFKGCADHVRIDRIDEALARLAAALGEK